MAEQQRSNTQYHLYTTLTRTYFSFKRPGGDSSYAYMYLQMHNGNITFRFSKALNNEDKHDYNVYLPSFRISDVANILEGMMGRRRNAFEQGMDYASDEVYKIPVCSYIGGKEEQTGTMIIDTEMCDGVHRLRITYNDTAANDSVSITFNERSPVAEITATSKLNKIDYGDLGAFDLAVNLKQLQEPISPLMYRFADSIVSNITKYISACVGGKSGGGNNYNKSGNNSGYKNYSAASNIPSDADEYDTF